MRTFLIGTVAGLALAVAAPANAATKTVNIYGSFFSPKSVTITEGDTVVWVNRDNDRHQILEDRGRFVSAILRPGQSYSFTFKAAGTYTYHDELHPKLKGTVVVKGAPPTLTLAVSASTITFGDSVTLTGSVSNQKAGETVTIYYQPYPQPNLIERARVLTGAGGSFSFIVKPSILTTYQAAWKGAFSLPASVEVAPKISLGLSTGWLIHVWGGRSFAGRGVQFQRYNAATGQWVTLRKVILDARSAGRVRGLKLPKGLNRLRVAMSVNQAGAGYLAGFSKVVQWRVH